MDEAWKRFVSALLPLDSAGKLGTVLFQFPPWFMPGSHSRDYIVEAKERLGQYRMAVEFRSGLWMSDEGRQERTLGFLEDNKIPYVCVDEPQGFKNSVPPVVAATASVALLRMHGQNAAMWNKKQITAAERFDYLYEPSELKAWVPRVKQLAKEAREVHVLMNNCHRDYSVRNAREIGEMLGVLGRKKESGTKEKGKGSEGSRGSCCSDQPRRWARNTGMTRRVRVWYSA